MKTTSLVSVCVLLFFAATAAAQNNGVSANGGFHFPVDGRTVHIELDARHQANDTVHGQISFSGEIEIPDQDVDGSGSGDGGHVVNLSVKVDVDCLRVSGNQAAMSGTISTSSVAGYVGKRAILAVEDGGEGSKAPADRFTWGVYGTNEISWVASDAELEVDPGVGLTWTAKDAEREDDAGIPSHVDPTVTCQTFPLGAYALQDLEPGSGNIQVKP
jgi:hypothetical protein